MGNLYGLLMCKNKGISLRYLLIAFLFTGSFSFTSLANKGSFTGKKVYSSEDAARSASMYDNIKTSISKFDVYEIDAKGVYTFVKQAGRTKTFTLSLDNQPFEFTLWENDVRSGNYILKVSTPNGDVIKESSEVTTYKGYINGDKNNRVRMAIRNGYVSGIFYLNGVEHSLQPVNAYGNELPSEQFLLYKTENLIATEGIVCDASLKGSAEKMTGNLDKTASSQAWVCAEIALAADYSFYQLHGANTEAVLTELINLVQDLYDQLEIQYKVTEVYIDEANQQNWTSSPNITQIMPRYSNWANANFSNPFDLTTLWTKVDIYGDDSGSGAGLIGRSGAPSVCTQNNFQICEYYAPWGSDNTKHRVNQAHEMGHSWGCDGHATGCSSCIMTPALSGTQNQWGSWAIGKINPNKSASCVSAGQCSFTDAPQAAFTSDNTEGCGSLTVQFTDNSTYSPSSWSWDYGDGGTSTTQNPTHTYSSPGTYTVTLTATNEYGNNTATKTSYITVDPGAPYAPEYVGHKDQIGENGGIMTVPADYQISMTFEVYTNISFKSIKVYAQGSGTRLFTLLDNQDNEINSANINVPDGESRVQFDWEIAPGTYKLALRADPGTLTDLYRDRAGASYPQTIPGVISITNNYYAEQGNPLVGWYIGYDWEIQRPGCDPNSISVNTLADAPDFEVYPNPVNDVFNIELPGADFQSVDVKIYNLIGEVVYQKSFGTASGVQKHQINLDALSAGNYLLHIRAGDRTFSEKIIKE